MVKVKNINHFKAVQARLTIDMIMTLRENISTRTVDETVAEVMSRNADRFSYFPVVDLSQHYIGLFCAEYWFDNSKYIGTVQDHFRPLSEASLIGADAGIIDFIHDVNSRPCRLVVSGNRIEGLACLTDLQKLPVRAALFSMITELELAMADVIRGNHSDTSEWIQFVSEPRMNIIRVDIQTSKEKDTYVDDILFTQFHDKADIIRKSIKLNCSKTRLKRNFKTIGLLRDRIAHSNNYATTPEDAANLSNTIKMVEEIHSLFKQDNSK